MLLHHRLSCALLSVDKFTLTAGLSMLYHHQPQYPIVPQAAIPGSMR